MEAFIIVLLALWIYPVLGLLIVKLLKNKSNVKKYIFYISFSLSGLTLIGMILNITTCSTIFDWLLVSSVYLSISIFLFWMYFKQHKLLKVTAIVFMVLVFGFGYLSASIGILGVGFVVSKYETDVNKKIGDNLIYKENTVGNALSDNKGKQVGVYKTISWLPIIEWQIEHKEYSNVITYLNPLTVDYNPTENELYLSAKMNVEKDNTIVSWADTIAIND